MADLLFYMMTPPSRASIVRWMLEELGEPYDTHVLDRSRDEQRGSDYLKINPMGKVPALQHGDALVTEAAAICLYLADAFPKAGLNIAIGDPLRGRFLKWLFFAPSCIEPAILDIAFPREKAPPRSAAGYGDFHTVMNVVADAVRGRPYIVGETFSAADVVIASQLRWGQSFGVVPRREEFNAYLAGFEQRPAFKRAVDLDAQLKKPS
ncbi:glutathione S-transferase [Terrihabitans soli]|uniref:Glutathione S-transferase n=1 Tax=Terrihabitans soli TaxID=708113 RepID=A0A6S6QW96_9HYPH|nr:glutathione S-transferase family protein [Terrihabitans soli]BCJ90788.1 glutathione S-transferase [Terrihabitans soli]